LVQSPSKIKVLDESAGSMKGVLLLEIAGARLMEYALFTPTFTSESGNFKHGFFRIGSLD